MLEEDLHSVFGIYVPAISVIFVHINSRLVQSAMHHLYSQTTTVYLCNENKTYCYSGDVGTIAWLR
jgi:hypothetical protein